MNFYATVKAQLALNRDHLRERFTANDQGRPKEPVARLNRGSPPALLSWDRQLCAWLPTVFAVLSSVLGVFYVFTTPPFQVPDEFAHLYRAYGLSEGYFVAPALTPIPDSIIRLTTQFPPHIEAVRKLTAGELVGMANDPLRPERDTLTPNAGMNVNTWIPYIPSALTIFIARVSGASPISIFYLGRLANLAGYIILTWIALRLVPACRLALFTVALMPMVLHQGAGLSWDSVVFGISFLFCALVISHVTGDSGLMERPDYIALFVGTSVVALCKVDFALLPLLLLIPTASFGTLRRRVAFLLVCVGGALVTSAIWQYLNRVNLQLFAELARTEYKVQFPDNIWYIYYNTGYVLDAVGRELAYRSGVHATELVGTFGWLFVQLPTWAVSTYLGLLLLAGIASLGRLHLSWFQRGVLLLVVLLGSASCVLAMWLATPNFYIQDNILHDVGTLYGIQGRHFIPFVFPALLIFSNRFFRPRLLWLLTLALALIIAVNAIALMEIRESYYVIG